MSEVEPNNDIEHAQKIALGTTVNGVITNEDVDCFLVAAKKGQRITAEVEGLRLGLDFFDPALAIMDTRRFVLASADDTPAVWQDAICSILAPADGNYVIELRESAFQGSQRVPLPFARGQLPASAGGLPGRRAVRREPWKSVGWAMRPAPGPSESACRPGRSSTSVIVPATPRAWLPGPRRCG